MSAEASNPVEEPVVAPTEAPVEAAVETAPAETVEPAAEAPAATEPAKEEETAAPVTEEVEEGTLGYKGPGLIKGFMFQKKFFWFGSEPVETKALASYLRGEKAQDVANQNAAWSSYTGKGLLYFSKKASEKTSPAGIFNLSEISDVTEEGTIDFFFTLGGHKHTFQAATLADRDNWVAVLKTKAVEAKELAPTVIESEKYKESHSALTKPVAAVATPKKSTDKVEPKEEKAEDKAEKKEEVKEEKKARKSRSASRKRNSLFGGFGMGKKEEKTEVAKEDAPVVATEESAAAAEPVAAAPETTEAAPAPVSEAIATSPTEARPAASKRNSIFGNLKSQFSSKKEKSETEAPAVPAKDAEPVSETAPVIPAVEASEPLATSVASPATVPAETTEVPVTNGETKTAPVIKSDKRKSSLPWMTKKEKPATSDEEAEKPKSPFAKLRATVKGKKTDKAAEKPVEATTTEEAPVATEETAAATEPVVSEPTPVVPQATAQVTASA